jgi:hypothetical protein
VDELKKLSREELSARATMNHLDFSMLPARFFLIKGLQGRRLTNQDWGVLSHLVDGIRAQGK